MATWLVFKSLGCIARDNMSPDDKNNTRWSAENMKTEGVMEIPNSSIIFVDAEHPIWAYVRENPHGEEMLKNACCVENHFKANRDAFLYICEEMQNCS